MNTLEYVSYSFFVIINDPYTKKNFPYIFPANKLFWPNSGTDLGLKANFGARTKPKLSLTNVFARSKR